MDKDTFQADFEASMEFMRLHGWCAQAEAMTNSVRAAARELPDKAASRATMAANKLDKAETPEEVLFGLAILQDLGMPAEKTAETIFGRLYGKLGDKDAEFFSSQFFEGLSPVPDYIAFELTDRVFLTYQRAIYHALKIDGFESDFDAPHILVFLTQLLCRSNVHPQNKAMIYLLISRIDTDLPDDVEKAVRRAIGQLKSVIREVEENEEKALSAGYESVAGDVLEFERESARQSVPLGSRIPGTTLFSQGNGSAPGTKEKKPAETRKPPVEGTPSQSAVDSVPGESSETAVKKINGQAVAESGTLSVSPETTTPKSERARAGKDEKATATAKTENAPISPVAKTETSSKTIQAAPRAPAPVSAPVVKPAERRKFKIRFSKEIPELSEILRLLRAREGAPETENAADEKNPFGEDFAPETPTPEEKEASIKAEVKTRKVSTGQNASLLKKAPEEQPAPETPISAVESANPEPEKPLSKREAPGKSGIPSNPEIREMKTNPPSPEKESWPDGISAGGKTGNYPNAMRVPTDEKQIENGKNPDQGKSRALTKVAFTAAAVILLIVAIAGGVYLWRKDAAPQAAQAPAQGNPQKPENPAKDIEPAPEPAVTASAATNPPVADSGTKTPETGDLTGQADAVPQKVTSQGLSETLGTDMRTEGNALVWYPRADESLWWLYDAILSSGTKVGYLNSLVTGGWRTYVGKIRSLNPDMDADCTIYAYSPLVIGKHEESEPHR